MRDHVRAGDEPWNTAFNAFASDTYSSKTPPILYQQRNDIFVNIRGPWAETINGVYYDNLSDYACTRATLLYTTDAAKTVGLSNQKILGGITGLTATASGSDTINLSWTAVPDALEYNKTKVTVL